MGIFKRQGMWDSGRVQFIPIGDIAANPNQSRRHFAPKELAELAESIAAMGILQPLTVRRGEIGWELVAGERRLRAAALAGLSVVPCLSITVDDEASSLLCLVENLQRKNLDFWEEATALAQLIAINQLSQEEVARRIGRSQSAVANKLRLLRLPHSVLSTLRDGGGTERHARALLRLEDAQLQLQVAQAVVAEHLSVLQTEERVAQLLAPPPPPPKGNPRRVFVPKDVRLFLNTLTRGVDLMRSAGVDACCQREDREQEILLTIHIPRPARQGSATPTNVSRETFLTSG